MTAVFGVDIGGSGIKGAPVDLERGTLAEERHKVLTPRPASPSAVVEAVREVVANFDHRGSVGLTFPGVVVGGRIHTAANVAGDWIGLDAAGLFRETLDLPVTVVNDADAAGLAEVRYGAGQGRDGVVLMLTFGTGIGSALFTDGALVPNTELGHLELRGKDAERRASSAARERHGLSWPEWAERVDEYLDLVEMLFSPQLIIVGGGVSRKHDKFLPLLKERPAEIVPALLRNDAGIVGAAMAAASG
ncbi:MULTISPECIES: polyphosphate--glucose phosphotransferase [unclassified Kitasatospora]|uniref:polyphosphate--glucose phosphotransferase n=1 Tax=unclassified Kitasatospora TaxID=2633591 RepID=UPI000708BE63|nr:MULTISPECIES: ROK family protein [unclassified Kitasatospora]KQV23907.1 polyphosphate glucokinase [Kitasatospora sp. Root107]KRB67381.1 polyphosphate glucokinase [Kitasatospora sp. Root187]